MRPLLKTHSSKKFSILSTHKDIKTSMTCYDYNMILYKAQYTLHAAVAEFSGEHFLKQLKRITSSPRMSFHT